MSEVSVKQWTMEIVDGSVDGWEGRLTKWKLVAHIGPVRGLGAEAEMICRKESKDKGKRSSIFAVTFECDRRPI